MVLVENWSFLHVFILGNIVQENVFYDILKGKNAFLGYINKKFKKCKKFFFFKGVSTWFMSKVCHFCIFFFGNKGQENVLHDILEGKKAFLGYKNKQFEKSKN